MLELPPSFTLDIHGLPMIADINPIVSTEELVKLQEKCVQCQVTADIGGGFFCL